MRTTSKPRSSRSRSPKAHFSKTLPRPPQSSNAYATSGWGVALLVFGGIAVLVVLALRERRPLLLAYLVALAVSLVVNDSPNDVIIAGLAGYLALSSAPGVARPASERARSAPPEPRAQSAPIASP